jgi:uncharacterized protein YllA (UPF0747 family)
MAVERALLPTVAYMAGPGELAYFAQVSAVSTALRVAMPFALPRTSMRIVTPEVQSTLRGLGTTVDDMRDITQVVRDLSAGATPDAAMDAVTALRAQVQHTAQAIRASGAALEAAALDGAVAQLTHRVSRLERRVLAASKRHIADQLRRVTQAQTLLWPHGAPQERVVNPLPWLARYGTPLLEQMQQACDAEAVTLVHGGD